MAHIDRIPSIPLIASDPYFSVWMPADDFTTVDTQHWAGFNKPIRVKLSANGETARLIGAGEGAAAKLESLEVLPTRTLFSESFSAVTVETCFATPAIPEDFDLLSMPVTLVTFRLSAETATGRHAYAHAFRQILLSWRRKAASFQKRIPARRHE